VAPAPAEAPQVAENFRRMFGMLAHAIEQHSATRTDPTWIAADLQRIEARLAGLEQSVSATLAVLNQLLQAVRRDAATEEEGR